MHASKKILGVFLLLGSTFFISETAFAEKVVDVNVNTLLQKATVSFSPHSGAFTEGSTFQVPITIDTEGKSVNAVELHISFNASKLQIIEPTGQKSIIGLWVEPPVYSNTAGTLKLVGVIPSGISTKSGLIANVTFKALRSGDTKLSMTSQSQVLANDGLGSPVSTIFGEALYTITPIAPEGPNVFSETHPFQDHWYNNNSPVLNWDKDPGVSDYSYTTDNQPFTVPENTANTNDNRISLPDVPNGISYFHLKSRRGGVWGGTTHFALHVDSLPPASFTPTYDQLRSGGTLVSFFTTDSLSGIDHYEVGVIDMNDPPNTIPVFVQAQSPYQLPLKTSGDLRVIVRAVDVAGNVKDAQLTVKNFSYLGYVRDNLTLVALLILLLLIVPVVISHYFFVRRVSRALNQAMAAQQRELNPPAQHYPTLPPTRPPGQSVRIPVVHEILLEQKSDPAQ
jgi:hypothetical protein